MKWNKPDFKRHTIWFFYITEPRVKITYVCDNKNDLELKTINDFFFNFFSSVISNSSDTDLILGNLFIMAIVLGIIPSQL